MSDVFLCRIASWITVYLLKILYTKKSLTSKTGNTAQINSTSQAGLSCDTMQCLCREQAQQLRNRLPVSPGLVSFQSSQAQRRGPREVELNRFRKTVALDPSRNKVQMLEMPVLTILQGLSWWLSGKEPTCQCRRHKRCEFDGNPLQYSCL